MEMLVFDMNNTEQRAEVNRLKAEKAQKIKQGQQLYARIKKSSKYFGQTAPGELFGVFVDPAYGAYCVQGGHGGQYRLEDVHLCVVVDGKTLAIS